MHIHTHIHTRKYCRAIDSNKGGLDKGVCQSRFQHNVNAKHRTAQCDTGSYAGFRGFILACLDFLDQDSLADVIRVVGWLKRVTISTFHSVHLGTAY